VCSCASQRRNNWGGGRGGGRDRGEKRQREGDGGAPPGKWAEATNAVFENAAFEEYYKAQSIVPEEEWAIFMETLRKPLPVTFRINGGGRFANQLRDKMQEDFFSHFKTGDAMVRDMHVQ
jgi:multisite-specific tRNA:(cytosine-C5)-methyltransferase